MSIDDLLRIAMERKASDLHLKVGNYPYLRVDGELVPLTDQPRISAEDMLNMAFSMMSNRQKQKFKEAAELDMAYGVAGLGRFRVNVFQQRGNVGVVLRVIPTKIRALDELYLPKIIEQICEESRGLVLVTAETGHLVFSTLHTLDAVETINRIISVFPPPEQKQIRLQMAAVLKAVVSQRLVRKADGTGRVPAVEVLMATEYIRECIITPEKTRLIHEALQAGTSQYGMQTFDQSLYELYQQGLITYETALENASKPDDFKLRVQGIGSTSDSAREQMESAGFGH